MNAMNQGERVAPKRYVFAAVGVVSMLALHGCVYVGGGCGSWGGGGGGWHGGGGGWHGGGRCDVGQPESVEGVRLSEGFHGPQRLDGALLNGRAAG